MPTIDDFQNRPKDYLLHVIKKKDGNEETIVEKRKFYTWIFKILNPKSYKLRNAVLFLGNGGAIYHDKEKKKTLKNAINNISQNQRLELIALTIDLLQSIRPDKRAELIKQVTALPPEERKEIIDYSRKLLAGPDRYREDDYFEGLSNIISKVAAIPKEERESVKNECTPLLTQIENPRLRASVFGEILNIKENRKEAIDKIIKEADSLWDKFNISNKDYFIECVSRLISRKRFDVLSKLPQLFSGVSNDPLRFLSWLPDQFENYPTINEELLNQISHMWDGVRDGEERIGLLQVIPPEHRTASVFNEINSVISSDMDLIERCEIITNILRRRGVSSNLMVLYGRRDIPKYKIYVERNQLDNDPKKVLDDLCAQFKNSKKAARLDVQFENEPGEDAGGLGRQLVAKLFAGIQEKMQFKQFTNGLYRPELHMENNRFIPLTDEDKKVYQQLGQLMMFCLNSSKEYPIGMLFDHAVFVALTKLQEVQLTSDFDKLPFNELFSIYSAMNYNEEDMKTIKLMKQSLLPLTEAVNEAKVSQLRNLYTAVKEDEDIKALNIESDDLEKLEQHYEIMQEVLRKKFNKEIPKALAPLMKPLAEVVQAAKVTQLKNLYASVEGDAEFEALNIEDDDLEKIEQHYEKMQEILRRQIKKEKILPALVPLIEISKGMRTASFQKPVSWDTMRLMSPETLSNNLQGKVEKKDIKLTFADGISKEKEEWFKEWIDKADDLKLKKFIFAMTGAYSIGLTPLEIKKSEEKAVLHTCYNFADIPMDLIKSKEDLFLILDAAITGEEFSVK